VPEPRKKLDFIFFDAGGGHRSAANALKSVIERQQRPWDIRLVNLQPVLRKGWTLGSPQLTKIMHGISKRERLIYEKCRARLGPLGAEALLAESFDGFIGLFGCDVVTE
jgi:hypothetical protein